MDKVGANHTPLRTSRFDECFKAKAIGEISRHLAIEKNFSQFRVVILPVRLFLLIALAACAACIHGLVLGPVELDRPRDEWGVGIEVVDRWSNTLWIDARPLETFQQGHLPGAFHLSLDNWDVGLGEILLHWEPGLPMVVYCDGAGCETSQAVARRLREELDEEQVYWLIGGWSSMSREGSP